MSTKLSSDLKVSLVTAICILVLAVVAKKVLNVELDFISQYGPVWLYIVYIITRDKQKESKVCSSPLFWSLAIIFATLAILALYAI